MNPAEALTAWSVPQAFLGIGDGRTGAGIAALVALTGVVIGGLALARLAGRISIGDGGLAGGATSTVGVIIGALHLSASSGGFGTGNGRAGAIVAMAVGLIGVALGSLAVVRARRAGKRDQVGGQQVRR